MTKLDEYIEERIKNIAIDLKELSMDVMDVDEVLGPILKIMANRLYAMANTEDELACNICGDYHDEDDIPLDCQTGDGT